MNDEYRRYFVLSHNTARKLAAAQCQLAPDGCSVLIQSAKRSEEQSEKFHAICTDIAKSGFEWAGKPRTKDAWKFLLISGHSVATKIGAEIVPGLEHEFVNLRESSSTMGVRRLSSLIEYSLAFCAMNNIKIGD